MFSPPQEKMTALYNVYWALSMCSNLANLNSELNYLKSLVCVLGSFLLLLIKLLINSAGVLHPTFLFSTKALIHVQNVLFI